MSNYSERLSRILAQNSLTLAGFCEKVGLNSTTTISKIVSENRKPSSKTIGRIINAFPEINYEWLTTGQGNMIKGDNLNKEINEDDLTVTARQILNKLEEDRIHYDSTRRELDKERLDLQMQILNKKFEELEEKMDANATRRAAGVSKVIGNKLDETNQYWSKQSEEKQIKWAKEGQEQKELFLLALDKVLHIEQDLENIKSFMAIKFEKEAIKKADKKIAKKLANNKLAKK